MVGLQGMKTGMQSLQLGKAFTLIESGPVVLVTTNDGQNNNVMTITWTMVLGFSAEFAITTGPWNYSYAALRDSRECVMSIPTVDLIDVAVGVGTCSGEDTDKFEKFGLTAIKAKHVRAPLIKECFANLECRVVETRLVNRFNLFVLEVVKAWRDPAQTAPRTLHHHGYGTFAVDGDTLKLPSRMP